MFFAKRVKRIGEESAIVGDSDAQMRFLERKIGEVVDGKVKTFAFVFAPLLTRWKDAPRCLARSKIS